MRGVVTVTSLPRALQNLHHVDNIVDFYQIFLDLNQIFFRSVHLHALLHQDGVGPDPGEYGLNLDPGVNSALRNK